MPEQTYFQKIKRLAYCVAKKNYEIILTPDINSSAELFAKYYKESSGKKVIGVFAKDDKELGYYDRLNPDVCDEIEHCGEWPNQENYLVSRSNNLLCLGLSNGVIIEICKTDMLWKKRKDSKIFIVEDFIPERLPDYISTELLIEYVNSGCFMI